MQEMGPKRMMSMILSMILLLCITVGTGATVSAAAPIATLPELQAAIDNSSGTAEAPAEIALTGEIPVTARITVPSVKYVKISGGSLTRSESFTTSSGSIDYSARFFSVAGCLALENITLDGGKEISGDGSLVYVKGSNASVTLGDRGGS